ncbi:MAG: hypothetical protein E7652_06680 [Ruminococcaceae bacterium]|nr:hypothetical protein [Oscillospiraceae bacterium]
MINMNNNTPKKSSPLDEIKRITKDAPASSQRRRTPGSTLPGNTAPRSAPSSPSAPKLPQRSNTQNTEIPAVTKKAPSPMPMPNRNTTPEIPATAKRVPHASPKPQTNVSPEIPAVTATASTEPSRAEKVRLARESAQRNRMVDAQKTQVITNIENVKPEADISTEEKQKEEARRLVRENAAKYDNSETKISDTVKAPENKEEKPAADTLADKTDDKADKKSKKKKKKDDSSMSEEFVETIGKGVLSNTLKAVIYLVAIFVISGALSIFAIMVANDCFAFVKSDKEVTVKIPEGATLDEIADILHDKEIIKYPGIFKFYIDIRNKDIGDYLSGKFKVSPSMSYDILISTLTPYTVREEVTVVIPEGTTTKEIIRIFTEDYKIGTVEGFEKAINEYKYDFWFLEDLSPTVTADRCYRLDGYLFPDTYNFFTDSSEVDIIYKLLSNFDSKFAKENLALVEDHNMTLDEMVILASMIQNEAKYVNTCKNDLYGSRGDYYMVSAVFHNRLNNPSVTAGKLDSDATVLYALKNDPDYDYLFKDVEKAKENVKEAEDDVAAQEKKDDSEENLQLIDARDKLVIAKDELAEANKAVQRAIADANKNNESLYNTYMYAGLPAGPICNPSLDAINAAMNPDIKATTEVLYYYFIADVDGFNYYATNADDHAANISTVDANAKAEDQ